MPHIDPELIFHRKWWWDPIDMEIFKELEQTVQRQVVAISLETQAQILKVQAEGVARIGNAVAGAKQSGR
ncbi:MAG TPA: hypothetical protein VFQ41_06655 [Candidatus Angelobacter sp.]|nr:hypothetical protein [Candidatus Angelobacter sp.]